MSDRENGLQQTPWGGKQPFDTPDVGGTGLNGIGGGLDVGAGGSGIIQTPYTKAESAPGMDATPQRDWPTPPNFVQVDGGGAAGSSLANEITSPPKNTIDKR